MKPIKLPFHKESLRALSEEQSGAIEGGVNYSYYCQTNKQGCLTHFVDCMTNRNYYC